jgi:hypothetical protein
LLSSLSRWFGLDAAGIVFEGAEVLDESLATARVATTLDRIYAAMLLEAGGRTNALSALYPKGSEENLARLNRPAAALSTQIRRP